MRRTTAILAILILTASAMAADDPATIAPAGQINIDTEETQSGASWITIQYIGSAPGMDEYRWGDEDFCWTHTFDPTGKVIYDVTLTINAWDVDIPDEVDVITADGVNVGSLTGADGEWSESNFSIDKTLLADGQVEICIDIDSTEGDWATTVDWSRMRTHWDWIPEAPEFSSLAIALAALLTTPAFAYLIVKRRK